MDKDRPSTVDSIPYQYMCGGGGTNLQAERRHSQYEEHNVAGMTEGVKAT